MNSNGQLLSALPEPSSTARQELERNLLGMIREQGVSPEEAVRQARARLPRIVPIISPPSDVVATISPATWQQLDELHRQAAAGVRRLRQGPPQSLLRQVATAPQRLSPPRPSPKPAAKPSWLRSGWLWFLFLGVVLPTGWFGAAVWSSHRAKAVIREASDRVGKIRGDTAAQQEGARQLESRLQTLQSQAQASLTAQQDKLEREAADLRNTINRWEADFALATGGFAVPSEASDALGNPVMRRHGDDTGPASGLPVEIVHSASGLTLVLVPAGAFQMGSQTNETGRSTNEGPVHLVRFDQPFYMSKYEVTQEQWQKVMGENPSSFKGDSRRPVDSVSWQQAQRLVGKLNEGLAGVAGLRFGLPSEAQWEYACRAGSTGRYGYGDDESQLGEYAWFDRNSGMNTHPVGQKKPNGWGLYDMHGNVPEWCEDVWHRNYGGAPSDGRAWTEGGDHWLRVQRGGDRWKSARSVRAAARDSSWPNLPLHGGVRVMCGVRARTP